MKIAVALYVVLRALLIVEMIRFLFYIPPDAYFTVWADSLPHNLFDHCMHSSLKMRSKFSVIQQM